MKRAGIMTITFYAFLNNLKGKLNQINMQHSECNS